MDEKPVAGEVKSVREQIETRMQEVGEFIREQRRLARLSVRKLAEMADVSNPYLSQIERGMRHPSAEILQAIAKALRISAETLYVRAGILEEREEDGDLSLAILRTTSLTEEQKQVLLQVYESFLAKNRMHVAEAGTKTASADAS